MFTAKAQGTQSSNPVLTGPHLHGDDNEVLFQYLFFPCVFAVFSFFSVSLR